MLFPGSSSHLRGAQIGAIALLSGLLGACNAIFGLSGSEPAGPTGAASSGEGGHPAASSSSGAGDGGTGGSSNSATVGSGGAPAAPVCNGLGADPATVKWSRHAGGSSPQTGDGVAFMSDGSVVLGGAYADDSTVFTGESLPYPSPDGSSEDYDLYVAKYDASGLAEWQTSFNGPRTQFMTGLAVDRHDDIVVAGYFQGSVGFGPSGLHPVASDVTQSPDAFDGFVVKLGPDGKPQWSRRFGGPNDDIVMGIATDSAANVIVTGVTHGGTGGATADFGCGDVDIPAGQGRVFLTKLKPDGSPGWCQVYAVNTGYINYWNQPYGLSVAVDAHDNIILAGGGWTGASSFGNGPLNHYKDVDTFVFVATPEGKYGWAGAFGDDSPQWATRVAVDPCGDVYLAGGFQKTIALGATPTVTAMDDLDGGTGNYSRNHVFVAKLVAGPDPYSYVPVWVKGFWDQSGLGAQEVKALAVDPWGNVAVAGNIYDDLGVQGVDFGDGAPATPPHPADDVYRTDAFVVKLGSVKGALRWSRRFGGTDYENGTALAIDGAGEMLFAGAFSSPLDFGKGVLTPDHQDVFLLKFAP
jgi:hypothetical protein